MQRLLALASLTHLLCAPNPGDGGGGGGAGGGAPAGGAPPPAPPPAANADIAALQAQLDEAKKTLAARDATDAEAKKKAEADRQAALAEQGQHKTLAEERAKEIEKLQKQLNELSGDAQLGKTYRETESKKLEEAIKALSPEDRALAEAVTDISQRAKLVARLSAASTKPADSKTPNTPPATGTPPAPNSVVDIDVVIKEQGAAYAAAKHPKEWDEYLARRTSRSSKPTGLFGSLFSGRN